MMTAEHHSVIVDGGAPNVPRRWRETERSLAVFLESVRLAEGEGASDELGTGTHATWRLNATVYWPSRARAPLQDGCTTADRG